MLSLKLGYIISSIITGFIFLFIFVYSIPDNKLHIYHCDVGQGDAAYIRFPSGQDMIIDGGPNNAIISCLSRYMPFWDRTIDLVLVTHPQKDHFYGYIAVLQRYNVKQFIQSEVSNDIDEYKKLMSIIQNKKIPIRYPTSDDRIIVSDVSLTFLWPTVAQIAHRKDLLARSVDTSQNAVLGVESDDFNDYCLVFLLSYGNFQALFTGDADTRVESSYLGYPLPDRQLELLKVPHHGSKTSMSTSYVDWIFPKLDLKSQASIAVISVGKNNYGHPSLDTVSLLEQSGVSVYQTKDIGDIEIITDGNHWEVKTHSNK